MLSSVGEKDKTKYIVCHNNKDVYHYVELTEGLVVDTGQPYLEERNTKVEADQLIATKQAAFKG